jgi:predicted naringenin-chalcone synthase
LIGRQEAYISSYGCSVPTVALTTEEWIRQNRAVRSLYAHPEDLIKFCEDIYTGSGIKMRYFCSAILEDTKVANVDDMDPDLKKMNALSTIGNIKTSIYNKANNYDPAYWERMKIYEETCIALSVDAAKKALANWSGDRSEITHILTTCTSGWREPGMACAIMKACELPQDCQKAELNFNGCFCGATCLRLARDIIRGGGQAVLVVACEVPSSHVDFKLTDRDNLVAQSLFADGAAAIIVTAKKGLWKFVDAGSSIVPNASHLLGLNPPCDAEATSYQMTLHKDVGPTLGEYFRTGHGKELLEKMYKTDDLSRPALCVHPGGPKILEAVGSVFLERGWHKNALDASYKSFNSFGNLGAAAMLFVLARRLALNDIEQDKLIMMAFGPGVTVEWSCLERATSSPSQ